MLKYHLTHILKQRGITFPVGYFMNLGFTRATAGRLGSGRFKNIPLPTLEKLCFAFRCTPNDLLEWSPDKNHQLDNAQPITGLIRDYSSLVDVRNIGIDIPYDKLSIFAEKMMEVKKELLNRK